MEFSPEQLATLKEQTKKTKPVARRKGYKKKKK